MSDKLVHTYYTNTRCILAHCRVDLVVSVVTLALWHRGCAFDVSRGSDTSECVAKDTRVVPSRREDDAIVYTRRLGGQHIHTESTEYAGVQKPAASQRRPGRQRCRDNQERSTRESELLV